MIARRRALIALYLAGVAMPGAAFAQQAKVWRVGFLVPRAPEMFYNTNCVLSCTPDVPDVVDRLAHFVDRILRGAKPGQLPFELPSRFNLVLNLKVARALGLNVPPALLSRADQVIQ